MTTSRGDSQTLKRKAAQDIGFVKDCHREVAQNLGLYKFAGRPQRATPIS